jgi:hypothetical protein
MALLIWAVWVVTKQVRDEKLEVQSAFNFYTQTISNSLKIKASPLFEQGALHFNDSSRLKTCDMKKVNMLLPFMQKLKRKVKLLVQWIRKRDDDSYDNPYLIY